MPNFSSSRAFIEGQEELLRVLQRAPLRAEEALARALYLEAREIMKKSTREYVPIDNGFLRASAAVGPPTKTGMGVKVEMGYGGAARAYAVVQHEDETLSHPPKNPRKRTGTTRSRRPGRAKYLSLAFEERLPMIPANLAVSCDRMFIKAGL